MTIESRVATLALTVRAPEAARERARSSAEAFATRVLTRCVELLDRRAPGRVFVLEHLDLALRLRDNVFDRDGEVDVCADAIASAIASRSATNAGDRTEWSATESTGAMYIDAIEWQVAQLEAWTSGTSTGDWRFAALQDAGEPIATFTAGDPEPLRALLVRAHRRGTLPLALCRLPPDVIRAAARTLGMPADREPSAAQPESPTLAEADPSRPLADVWLRVVAAAHANGGAEARASDAAARSTFAQVRQSRARAMDSSGVASPTGFDDESTSIVLTELGGVFYLLRLVLELSIGESLWRTCLPEGRVLASAFGALVGEAIPGRPERPTLQGDRSAYSQPERPVLQPETPALRGSHDPALTVIADAPLDAPMLDITVDQLQEVTAALVPAWLRALAWRGLTTVPHPVLRRVETPHGRLLVATADGSPHVFAAIPADGVATTHDALATFLTWWPVSAPRPLASRALAELDRRARLRPLRDVNQPTPLIVEGASLAGTALQTQLAGSLGHLFAARAGTTATDLPARLRVPARVAITADTITVEMPMDRIDIAIRRAALDRDPGWIPWLRRTVTISYRDANAADNSPLDCGV